MAYIWGLTLVFFLFLSLHYFTETTKNQKILITIVILVIIIGAISFNKYSASQRENILDIVMRFNQHKTIHCNKFDINSTNFTLSIGTYTFIAKENTPYTGEMIAVSQCIQE